MVNEIHYVEWWVGGKKVDEVLPSSQVEGRIIFTTDKTGGHIKGHIGGVETGWWDLPGAGMFYIPVTFQAPAEPGSHLFAVKIIWALIADGGGIIAESTATLKVSEAPTNGGPQPWPIPWEMLLLIGGLSAMIIVGGVVIYSATTAKR